jgi:hypothetical protein
MDIRKMPSELVSWNPLDVNFGGRRDGPWFFRYLKGLSHEIDFKNVDNNLQNLA